MLWSLGIAIFSVLILTALMYFNVPETDLPLILHYSIYRGVDFLGQSSKIFSLPLIILALMIINTIIADFFYKKEKIISYLFMIALPLIAFFLLLAGINLILINR